MFFDVLSLIGIIIGLALLIVLAFKGHSIIWCAPLCAVIVVLFSLPAGLGEGNSVLSSYIVDFMSGVGNYVKQWFPAFFLGAVFGKLMDVTGAARSLADALVKLVGKKFALLAVALPCMLLTYGGVSLFVVVFVMYPMGYAIFRTADIPRKLLPGAIAYGAFGITMTCIPGTPQIQNIIPTKYFGTTAAAAPLLSIIAIILIGVPGYLYLTWRINSERKKGLHFEEDPKFRDVSAGESYSKWHFITGVIPIVAVIVSLNFINWRKILSWTEEAVSASDETNYKLVISLLIAIALCCVLNLKRCRKLIFEAINDGSQSSLAAIMNTSCAVGFGNVVKTVTGFELLKNAVLSIPGNVLISETIAMNVLCGATGSASGGLTITLDALGEEYLARAAAQGISPEALHRIASVASGGLDTMPHNGAVITLLAVSNCTQKESFLDMFVTVGIIPLLASPILALIGGIIA